MDGIISSASLIFTSITLLFTVWQKSIQESIEISTELDYRDLANKHKELKITLFSKALPLTIFASLATVIYFPVAINIILEAYQTIFSCIISKEIECSYRVLKTVFILIELSLFSLSLNLWLILSKILRKNYYLNQNRSNFS